MLKALLDREPAVADTYLPMRQQFAIVGGQRVSRMALTMPGLVFVRGSKNHIVALLREKSGASRLMVDSSRKEKDAMVVADSEMTAFRLFNDNTAGQLMMLRSPFCNFTSADRIRIMSGPFAGYEGYIREIGGDNKLIFKVGSMAIALSNVMRYDVAVVENHHASTETSLQLRIADSLRARLEEAGHVDDACDRLRDIMTGAAGMPAAFTDADRADARSLAHFCASDRKRIDSIVGNAPLRRFLTPTAETGIKASLNTGCQPRSATTVSPPTWRNIPTVAPPPAGASLPKRYAPLRPTSAPHSSTSCAATDSRRLPQPLKAAGRHALKARCSRRPLSLPRHLPQRERQS